MLYTVGETAKILNIASSTLRFYDKEGLLPFVKRSKGGMRVFEEEDFNRFFIIDCLKKSGLTIKEIRRYIDMTLKGDETIGERLEMFEKQREKVLNQMEELKETLDILEYKCQYYKAAKEKGSMEAVKNLFDEKIPEKLRTAKADLEKISRK